MWLEVEAKPLPTVLASGLTLWLQVTLAPCHGHLPASLAEVQGNTPNYEEAALPVLWETWHCGSSPSYLCLVQTCSRRVIHTGFANACVGLKKQ